MATASYHAIDTYSAVDTLLSTSHILLIIADSPITALCSYVVITKKKKKKEPMVQTHSGTYPRSSTYKCQKWGSSLNLPISIYYPSL